MPEVKFEDNRIQVKGKIKQICILWLIETAGEIKSHVQRNSRVDTGKTKGSWEYRVESGKMEAYVGSDDQNAIWEEYGTGQYALKGNGRKKPWKYKDAKGNWHTTKGKKPMRMLYKAFAKCGASAKVALERKLKEL